MEGVVTKSAYVGFTQGSLLLTGHLLSGYDNGAANQNLRRQSECSSKAQRADNLLEVNLTRVVVRFS